MHRFLAVILCAFCFLAACETRHPSRDAGDEQWVRQAAPKALGRRLWSQDELRVYRDLLRYFPRHSVAQAMIATNAADYRAHWSTVLVDHLWVSRGGSIGEKVMTGCYAPDAEGDAAASADLARWVRANEASDSWPDGNFSMADLLASSLRLDDLSPLMRAHLFMMTAYAPCGANAVTEEARRQDISDTFHKAYLGRKMSCLGCHNSAASVTGPASGWERHFPLVGFYEHALYGDHSGPAEGDETRVHAVFRTRRDSCGAAGAAGAAEGDVRPFGMACDKVEFAARAAMPVDPIGTDASFAGLEGDQVSVWDLEDQLRLGIEGRSDPRFDGPETERLAAVCASCEDVTETPVLSAAQTAQRAAAHGVLEANCAGGGCHTDGTSPSMPLESLARFDENLVRIGASGSLGGIDRYVTPGSADDSVLYHRITACSEIADACGRMPAASGLSPAEIASIRDWINNMPIESGCDLCGRAEGVSQDVPADGALAALTRQNLVNSIHQEVFGEPLVVANYFPRNEAQSERLWVWTAFMMPNREWSLQNTVATMLSSTDLFNRSAPADAGLGDYEDHFELWPLFDPWTPLDEREEPVSSPGYDPDESPQNHKNSVADGVHRHNVRTLFNSLHEALGWPEPDFAPPRGGFPSAALMTAMGQRLHDFAPGFQGIGFSGLVQWENAVGACSDRSGTRDWLGQLVDRIREPGAPALSVEDAVRLLKDRLVNDTSLVAEEEALRALFGADGFAGSAAAVADLEAKLRVVCGSILLSPQFLLAGVPVAADQPGIAERICLDGEDGTGEACGYREICKRVRAFGGLPLGGAFLVCPGSDTGRLRVRGFSRSLIKAQLRLCPRGRCGFVPFPPGFLVPSSPRSISANSDLSALQSLEPVCDPTCQHPGCCGKMPDMVLGMGDGILVAPAAGGKVRKASLVWRFSASGQLEEVTRNDLLVAGDLLMFEPGAVFRARTPLGGMRTTRRGLPAWDGEKAPWFMLVAQAGSSEREIPKSHPGTVSVARQRAVLARPGARWGEAGARATTPVPVASPSPVPPDCPGDFGSFHGSQMEILEGDCLTSGFSLAVSCPVVKVSPFGDAGDVVKFDFQSPSIVSAVDLTLGGMDDLACELEAFGGAQPFFELRCQSVQGQQCTTLLEPAPAP